MSQLLDQIKQAIESSGQSRYAISQATGIDQAVLSRLMNGKGAMGFDTLDRLTDFLGLEIIVRPKTTASKRTHKKRVDL